MSPTTQPQSWVAGVDGCAGGWLVVLLELHTRQTRWRVVASFANVLALPEQPYVT